MELDVSTSQNNSNSFADNKKALTRTNSNQLFAPVKPALVEKARKPISIKQAALSVLSLLIVLLLWQLLAMGVTHVRGIPFPTPLVTLQRLLFLAGGKPLLDYSIYKHLGDSLIRWGIGFGIAMLFGIIGGLILGWSRILEKLMMPTIHVLQLIPGLAWVPIAILLFGINEKSTIFMIVMTGLTPIILNTTAGVKGVNENYIRAARMMGANDRTLFMRVLLPGSLASIITGLRIGLANGWRVLVAAEMIVGTGTGLGYSILQARWTLDYASAFVCLLIICLIGLIMERGVFAPLERRTIERWGVSRA